MSKNSEQKRQLLESDIQTYICGHLPPLEERENAPQLDFWKAAVRQRGKKRILVVQGIVSRHPHMLDGKEIDTGAVVWWDRMSRFVRTKHLLYVLGAPAEQDIPIEGIDV